jgi:hypothetical protein
VIQDVLGENAAPAPEGREGGRIELPYDWSPSNCFAKIPAKNLDTRPPRKSNPIEEQPTNLVAANLKRSATMIRFSTGLDGTVQYVQGYPPDHPSRVRCFPLARQSRKLL